jgi:hypothetical protein
VKDDTRTLFQATSTPLASIFGSGFLVIVPILAGALGRYSVVGMAAVCALAYAVGMVIRYNIRYAEPAIEGGTAPEDVRGFDRVSDLAIVLAYVISITLYLRILAAFLLGGFDADTELNERIITTIVIGFIMLVAVVKGLDVLQKLEAWALWVTIGIIVTLLVGFGIYDLGQLSGAGIQWPPAPNKTTWQILTILGGTLIVVQGFETPRFLSQEYDTETRVRSSRLSQIIATVVYLAFVALATPLMHFLGSTVEDNALIMLAGKVAAALATAVIGAAVLSQFSAAVADTMAAEGNLVESSRRGVTARAAYVLIGSGAIVLTWSASTLTILALASRAFAFYYLLQCFVAFGISKNGAQRVGLLLLAGVLAFITVFAVPAG